jgi:uncharacterized protein (UPF0333 family)
MGGYNLKSKAQTAIEFLLLVGGSVVFVSLVAYFVKTNVTG